MMNKSIGYGRRPAVALPAGGLLAMAGCGTNQPALDCIFKQR